jgi:hypothetical protein
MKLPSQKRLKRASAAAEHDFATALGGRRTWNSGAGPIKGDGRVPGRYRIETKCPPTGQFRLPLAEWVVLKRAADEALEVPLFHLKLKDMEIVILREKDYEALAGAPLLEATYGGESKTFHFTRGMWQRVLSGPQRLRFTLSDPMGRMRTAHLVAMPRTHFLEIAENL